ERAVATPEALSLAPGTTSESSMSARRKTPINRISVGISWRREIRPESTPAIRAPRIGRRIASDQKRTRNGAMGKGRRLASREARATRLGWETPPRRGESEWAQMKRRADAWVRLPGETTFWDARRKNSRRAR